MKLSTACLAIFILLGCSKHPVITKPVSHECKKNGLTLVFINQDRAVLYNSNGEKVDEVYTDYLSETYLVRHYCGF